MAGSAEEEGPGALIERDLRVLEALLFASREPLSPGALRPFLSDRASLPELLAKLQERYRDRGVNLVQRGEAWAFRTAPDLAATLHREAVETKPLSRAALEILAIIAYHQPATRAEIEEVRGVSSGRGTLDILMAAGWVRMRGRRRAPGRPVTYGTTAAFLDHFGLQSLADLPGLDELKGAGLLSGQLPAGFHVPVPLEGGLADDDDPLAANDAGESGDGEAAG